MVYRFALHTNLSVSGQAAYGSLRFAAAALCWTHLLITSTSVCVIPYKKKQGFLPLSYISSPPSDVLLANSGRDAPPYCIFKHGDGYTRVSLCVWYVCACVCMYVCVCLCVYVFVWYMYVCVYVSV